MNKSQKMGFLSIDTILNKVRNLIFSKFKENPFDVFFGLLLFTAPILPKVSNVLLAFLILYLIFDRKDYTNIFMGYFSTLLYDFD